MYLILNSKDLICEVTEHPCFVRKQANGVVVNTDEEHADAIYSNDSDTFYPLDFLYDRYILVEVEEVPEDVVAGYYYYHAREFYTTEESEAALEKIRKPENDMTDLQLALADVYEMILGGDDNG